MKSEILAILVIFSYAFAVASARTLETNISQRQFDQKDNEPIDIDGNAGMDAMQDSVNKGEVFVGDPANIAYEVDDSFDANVENRKQADYNDGADNEVDENDEKYLKRRQADFNAESDEDDDTDENDEVDESAESDDIDESDEFAESDEDDDTGEKFRKRRQADYNDGADDEVDESDEKYLKRTQADFNAKSDEDDDTDENDEVDESAESDEVDESDESTESDESAKSDEEDDIDVTFRKRRQAEPTQADKAVFDLFDKHRVKVGEARLTEPDTLVVSMNKGVKATCERTADVEPGFENHSWGLEKTYDQNRSVNLIAFINDSEIILKWRDGEIFICNEWSEFNKNKAE